MGGQICGTMQVYGSAEQLREHHSNSHACLPKPCKDIQAPSVLPP